MEKNVTTTVTVLAEIVHRKVIAVLNLQMESCDYDSDCESDAAMKARFGTNVRQNFRTEKNVITAVTVPVAVAGAQVDVVQKFRMMSCDKNSDCESGRCDEGFFLNECAAKSFEWTNMRL